MNSVGSFARGIKRPERDADHSPPFTSEVRMSVAILYYLQFQTTTNKTVVCVITGSYFSIFEDCSFLSTSLFVLSPTDDVTAVPCFQKNERPFPGGCFEICTGLRRLLSSEMLRRAIWYSVTNVSEKPTASIFGVTFKGI